MVSRLDIHPTVKVKALFFTSILMVLVLVNTAYSQDITLVWDANLESNVSWYNIYIEDTLTKEIWQESGPYHDPSLDVLTYQILGLDETRQYCFKVTALNDSGYESPPSDEICTMASSSCTDNDGDGFALEGGTCGPVDCNDQDAMIYPGARDLPLNGIDENCNGADSYGFLEIFWRNASNGQNRIWQMDGLTRTDGKNIPNMLGDGWVVGGRADFDADGKVDIMWRDQGGVGQNRLWLMDGYRLKEGNVLPLLQDTDWVVGGVDDFDGDGQADIFWRNTHKPLNRIWLMDNFIKKQGGALPIQTKEWIVGGTGDFDGDGKADILWRNKSNGQNRIWLMNGLSMSSGSNIPSMNDLNWKIAAVGDFDGDNKVDIFWRNDTTGQNRLWLMDGFNRKQGAAFNVLDGTEWSVGSLGDFNHDGKADILWRNTNNGLNEVWLMDGVTRLQNGTIPWMDPNWSTVQ